MLTHFSRGKMDEWQENQENPRILNTGVQPVGDAVRVVVLLGYGAEQTGQAFMRQEGRYGVF